MAWLCALVRSRSRWTDVVVAIVTLLFPLMLLSTASGCGRSDFGDDETSDSGADTLVDGGSDTFDGGEDVLPDAPPPPDGGTLVAISVEPASVTLPIGGKDVLTAKGLYSDGSTADLTPFATWTSDNPMIVGASPGGVIVATSAGSARIRATYMGVFGEADVLVKSSSIVSIRVDPPFADLPIGGTQAFTATAVYADGTSSDVSSSATWSISPPGIAKVSTTGLVTGVSTGTGIVNATFGGLTGSAKLSVSGKTIKSIDISPFSPTVGVGVSVSLTATALYTDGSKSDVTASATWSSADATVATVAVTGATATATGVTPGSTVISATFGGLTGSTPITVSGAKLTGISISPSAATIAVGGTAILKATANYSDGSAVDVTATAVWSSADTTIATASGGIVTGVAAGSTTVTASFGGATGSAAITVSPAKLLSITITPNPANAPLGSKVTFKATGVYEGGATRDVTNDVTWSTDDASVATVSNAAGSKGQITPIKVGSTGAHATLDGIVGNATINVTAATVTSITVSPNPMSLVAGDKQFASAKATYSDGSVVDVTATCTWSSADAKVATVSNGAGAQGQVTAVGPGTTSVSCTLAGVTGSTTVSVTSPTLASVSVSPINPTCRVGDVLQFNASAISTAGTSTNVTFAATWSSSSTSIVGPSGFAPGRFRCNAKGTATITATYGGKSGSSTVTVSDAVLVSLEVDPVDATIPAGSTQQYQAIAHFSDGTTQNVSNAATWVSTNTAVAGISNAGPTRGRATAISAGTTTIKATYSGVTGSTTLTVSTATVVSISITPSSTSLPAGVTYQYSAQAIYSDGTSKDVTNTATWVSSNAAVVDVSNAFGTRGQAKTLSSGTATVSATFSGVTGNASVTVTTAKLKLVQVTPFNPTLPIGYGIRMTATAVYDDGTTLNVTSQATWTSSNAGVASVSNAPGSRGRVTPIAAGTTSISATYNGVTGSTTVTVTSATLSTITISPNPANVAIGGNQQLTATGTFSDGSTLDVTEYVAWTSSNSSVADVSNAAGTQGVVYGFAAGSVTVTAQKGAITGTTSVVVK